MPYQITEKGINQNRNGKVSEIDYMVLTTAKPNNKKIREITRHYFLVRPREIAPKVDSPFWGSNAGFINLWKCYEHEFYKQDIAWDFWDTASIHKSLPVFLTEKVAVDKIEESRRIDKSGTDILISYADQSAVEALLEEQGKKVLRKTLMLINNTAREFKWPLNKIEIQCASDIEVKNWNYVLLVLFFNSSFDTANECLHLLYGKLDGLATSLISQEQDILRKLIYFDVETTTMVSSS